MKTIGLLGGMSWESTVTYYRIVNEATRRTCGGLHSAPIAMVSVDFAEIEQLQHQGNWEECTRILCERAREVEAAGADMLLICTNTMHKVADDVAAAIDIPLLHIADATADRILRAGYCKVGLLGTAFTMQETFYRGRLEGHGLEVIVPVDEDMEVVHRVIYDELCLGEIKKESRAAFVDIVEKLSDSGAECVIAGCTEIGLLINAHNVSLPLFDTTEIHAEEAVVKALL